MRFQYILNCRTQLRPNMNRIPNIESPPPPFTSFSFRHSVFDSRIYNRHMLLAPSVIWRLLWLAPPVIGALLWLAPLDRSPYAGHKSRRDQDNCHWENPPSVLHPGEYQVGGTSTYHRIGPCLTQSFVTVSVSILVRMDPYWDGFPDPRSSSELTIIKFDYCFRFVLELTKLIE